MKKTLLLKIIFVFIFTVLTTFFYVLFLRSPTIKLYCQQQIEAKINNFRRSVRRNAQLIAIEDENLLQSFKKPLIQQCIDYELKLPL